MGNPFAKLNLQKNINCFFPDRWFNPFVVVASLFHVQTQWGSFRRKTLSAQFLCIKNFFILEAHTAVSFLFLLVLSLAAWKFRSNSENDIFISSLGARKKEWRDGS